MSIELDPSQERAVELICSASVGVVTGGPGCGKTTCLRYALDELDRKGASYLLAAPTGKAGRRMMEATGREASTIHRLLGFHPVNGWAHDHDCPLDADLVVIDEASMLDIELAAALFDAIDSKRTRIILIGDADQLPPVGPGRVFGDLIDSGLVPVARLTTLHRAAQDSWVCVNAHRVICGQMPDLAQRPDFRFLEVAEAAGVVPALRQLLTVTLPRELNVQDAQVLIPQHRGAAGLEAANPALQLALNPAKGDEPYIERGGSKLRAGDRVIHTRNNYTLGVFNGEMGDVGEVTTKGLTVDYPDRRDPVAYSLEQAGDLQLAYALTVHKCVAPETLVETAEGLLPIRDIAAAGTVATAEGSRRYDQWVENPSGELLRVRTRNGYELKVTPDHRLMAWDGSGYRLVFARDITAGTFLRLRLGCSVEPERLAFLPPAPADLDARTVAHRIPSMVSEAVAEFLGLMVADGSVFRRGFRLAKRHLDVAQRFAGLCFVLFEINVLPQQMRGTKAWEVSVGSRQLSDWLMQVGGLGAHAKAVPDCILRSPLRVQQKFLRGLFEDGGVNSKGERVDHVEWSTSSEEMSRVVQVMLLRCGIISRRRKYGATWRIHIYGRSAAVFAETIGFVSERKNDRLQGSFSDETRDLVPVAHGRVPSKHNANSRGYVSRRVAREIGGFDEELAFHHDRVDLIEPMQGTSMCVRVPEVGRFLQNGFDGSNSQGSEWPWVVVVCHSTHTFILSRQLFYTAVTRAKKGVIVVGDKKGIRAAIAEKEPPKRNTGLVQRLRGEI